MVRIMDFKQLIILLLVGLLTFGCVTWTPDQPVNKTEQPPQVKNPTFDILSPLDEATITTTANAIDLTVKLRPNNFALLIPGGNVKDGEGHFHLTLDGTEAITAETAYTFQNVTPGQHTLRVEIRQNDHTSYTPKITKTITFTVMKEEIIIEPKTYGVTINNFVFQPAEITIFVGDTVTWKNDDKMPHTATSLGNFDTGAMQPGTSNSITFDKVGAYNYICTIHPNMKGKITVVEKPK